MGKTGTTTNFRDALFVGSTYGPQGITVAVRIGFDDNRELGEKETGGRAALPIFREIMLRVYDAKLVGPVPTFPREIEDGIDRYLALQPKADTLPLPPGPPAIAPPPVAPAVADSRAIPDQPELTGFPSDARKPATTGWHSPCAANRKVFTSLS